MGSLGKNADYSLRLARDTEFRNGSAVPYIGNSWQEESSQCFFLNFFTVLAQCFITWKTSCRKSKII